MPVPPPPPPRKRTLLSREQAGKGGQGLAEQFVIVDNAGQVNLLLASCHNSTITATSRAYKTIVVWHNRFVPNHKAMVGKQMNNSGTLYAE